MNQIAMFSKVSFEQYQKDVIASGRWTDNTEMLRKEWENIRLPERATKGSAGYDFFLPYFTSLSKNPVCFPTGIRCEIEPGWVLMLFPKSGLGFKHHMVLDNTAGVIDADYYHSDNEGHIQAKFRADHPFTLEAGMKYMQGIFLPFGITKDDAADGVRNGGFGSTGA